MCRASAPTWSSTTPPRTSSRRCWPPPTTSGADVVYDLAGGDFVERSWRCTARGGRYLAVGFADDDDNGMTGRPAAHGLHRQHRHRGGDGGLGRRRSIPGMRRFGFNPFGRDVADEIHADLLRLVADGSIRPSSAGGWPWRRPAPPSTTTRQRRSLGRTVVRGGPVSAPAAVAPSTSPGATPSCAALRSRPSTRWAHGLPRLGLELPSLAPIVGGRGGGQAGRLRRLRLRQFREPLEVFLGACERRGRAHHLRAHPGTKMLAAALANRIDLHRWSLDHPEVREERIDSPWVIVGLPRTGTSLLSDLLGLDPMARPLRQWEAAHPIPPPRSRGPRRSPHRPDGQGARRADEAEPAAQAMHPFGATLAQECVSLFMYDVRTLALETQAHVPTYARWLEQADMAPAYAQHRWPSRPCSRPSPPSGGS